MIKNYKTKIVIYIFFKIKAPNFCFVCGLHNLMAGLFQACNINGKWRISYSISISIHMASGKISDDLLMGNLAMGIRVFGSGSGRFFRV